MRTNDTHPTQLLRNMERDWLAESAAMSAELNAIRAQRDELLADLRQASAALCQPATYPADIRLAKAAIARAIARMA